MFEWLFKPAAHSPSAVSAHAAADRLVTEGNRAEREGQLREACELYRKAVAAAPGWVKGHLNLGIGLEAVGEADAAMAAYEAALATDPADPYVNYNLGRLLCARGALERAQRLLRSALALKPDFPEALVALSNVYDARGELAAAAAVLEEALRWEPDYAGAWYNYGDILRKLGRRVEAESALRRSIELDRTLLSGFRLLGNMLRDDSRIGEALELFGTARKLAPQRFDLESMELHAFNFSDEIADEALSTRHRAFGARLEKAFPERFAPFGNNRDPARRLRIGYVSSDFRLHPVALFMIPVLEGHNRSAADVYCYSTGSATDDITRQISHRAHVWRAAAHMSDSELAEVIHDDAIDVLVDLAGHRGDVRLGVFAQRPAPVQVSWLGYLNTTGLTRIQYRLCDAYTDPPGLTEQLHTETLVRLPHSQWCYRPFLSVDPAIEPPCKRNGFITFGSFNYPTKLSPAIRRLWCAILNRLPDSRLVVVGVSEGHARDRLVEEFERAGIAASRIKIAAHVLLEEYFGWFNAVDIALDTAPYSGGTTTCDTLWMGVPVITSPGSRSVSRSAASILSTVGLSAWIAPTPEDYVRFAVEFSREQATIAQLRASLRGRMRESPLMDETGFVRDLEQAYRQMWHSWCGGGAPAR